MKNALIILRNEGNAGSTALQGLLEDETIFVRCWATAELLSRGVAAAATILEEIADDSDSGIVGLDARMTPDEHQAGRLRSPFGLLFEPPV